MTFKVGDRVLHRAGGEGTVEEIVTRMMRVRFDESQDRIVLVHEEFLTKTTTENAVSKTTARFEQRVQAEVAKIADLLISKNRKYGDSALNPVRTFSKADSVEQIKVRIDDKLSRIQRGQGDDEDTVTDLIGYLILMKIAEAE